MTIEIKNYKLDNTLQTMNIQLQGGSPWFGYIWIDNVCYTIYMGPRKLFTIKKTKL